MTPDLSLSFSPINVFLSLTKGKLSQKFKVSGIPTLVMVNAETGQLISAEGRSIIMEDKQGEGFPWKPKPFLEVIQGKLLGKHDKEVPFENVKDKILGIYFSAHWVRYVVN